MNGRFVFAVVVVLTCLTLAAAGDAGRFPNPKETADSHPQRVMVLDGSNVHDVGELLLHVGNWGIFGSWPGSGQTFSHAPSGEWPAGSGVEYLFTTGLWVGALKSGVPAVSTAAYEFEFRPTQDPIDIIYRASEGDTNGTRDFDDDGDGSIDEDWLNGHDDDVDGSIDEDFAAISDQMFSCWYTDDQPIASVIYPQHNPMGLHVRQESYQWADDRFDDCVGVEYTITNISASVLEEIYVGLFADVDAGMGSRFLNSRITGRAGIEDASGYWYGVRCTDFGPVELSIAYTYDADGDRGFSPGYFGVVLLGHTTDPEGDVAPKRAAVSAYANFAGELSFEEGGDPTNDFERYELLSAQTIERNASIPRDYRTLLSVGPFAELLPDSTIVFQVALVAGDGLDGMIDNAANAKALFDGKWIDQDGDPLTGIAGRETPVVGPAAGIYVDPCACPACPPVGVPGGTTLYINSDCAVEDLFMSQCGFTEADSLEFRTGVGGKEKQVHWVIDEPSPTVRAVEPPPEPALQNHPNPFNATTTIVFTLKETEHVVLTIYSADGRRVRKLVEGTMPIGSNRVFWDGRDDKGNPVSSGVYIYRLEGTSQVLTSKMLFLK